MTVHSFGAIARRLAGERRRGDPVRAHSFDVASIQATRIFRPVGDGTIAGAARWREKFLQVAEEYEVATKRRGAREGQLGPSALRLLRQMLLRIDFKTGRLDPSYSKLQEWTGFCRETVARALGKLKAAGFLDWVRRSEKTGEVGERGPLRRQISNAYGFDPSSLPRRVYHRLQQLLRRPTQRNHDAIAARLVEDERVNALPLSRLGRALAKDEGLAGAIDRLGRAVENRESTQSDCSPAKV